MSLASAHDTPRPPDDEPTRLVGSDRVLALLKELASHPGGVSLDELTRAIASPKPTVHRALVSLKRAGFASQDAHGHYVLGDEFLRLAFVHHEARPDHIRIAPILQTLAERFGETVHYAVLDGESVVYRAKVDAPRGAVQLTSVVGGRNPAHATGVGKMLLAENLTSRPAFDSWMDGRELERRTDNTICHPDKLWIELQAIKTRGYSLDDQENEVGINCISFPVYLQSPSAPSGAISVSALAYRTPLTTLISAESEIKRLIGAAGPA